MMIRLSSRVALLLTAIVLSACSGNRVEEETESFEPTAVPEDTSGEPEPTPEEELTGPGPRIGSLIYFNPASRSTEIIGGYSCDMAYRFEAPHYQDLWDYDFDSGEWTLTGEINIPNMVSAAYDSESERLIIVSQAPMETWAYDPQTKELENMAPDDMPPDTLVTRYLWGIPMAYDSESDRLILYGGVERPGLTHEGTWVYDYNTNTWTNMQPENGPSPRAYHQLVYDSESDRVILWGGYPNTEEDLNIWIYDFNSNTWEELQNNNGPTTHFERFGMIYRPLDDRIYLYSGFHDELDSTMGGSEDREEMMNTPETWSYDLNSNTWQKIETEANPGQRMWYSFAYNETADQIFMYGGETSRKHDVRLTNAVWLFDFASMEWNDATRNLKICDD